MIRIILLILLLAVNASALSPAMLGTVSDGASSTTDYTADANCQGAWLFADDLTDESGEGNTLTDGGTVSYSTSRPDGYTTGKSIDGDGSSDYVYIAIADQSANFTPKSIWTDSAFCVWAYHDTSVGGEYIIASSTGFLLSATYDDKAYVLLRDSTGDTANQETNSFALTDWIHTCVSYDGSATELTMWMSTDGGTFGDIVDGGTYTYTNVDNIRSSATDNFAVGAGYGGGANWFDGKIYQPIIFNRELLDDGSEAENIYNDGIKGAD